MKINVNNDPIEFKIRYKSDDRRTQTITFAINTSIEDISPYKWEKIIESLEEKINEIQ